ncbi:unnamed protein product [Vitrella brassicaformis CCMP3155]|uniref:Uncharacterized protein n=1 Tax=Vitrella brassicaformis (strain CCMP3155) TaxID=1169540 RepID=A0A0G4G6W3_VITBC|nr:unnamed protein product [Vitrella brassicaformis CCMP3155]|eukprot:CEM23952.1 unnamed protein product [Vitrella brassicaformis CCMP3155]
MRFPSPARLRTRKLPRALPAHSRPLASKDALPLSHGRGGPPLSLPGLPAPPRAEEVQAESYLITDPEECLGLLPALFGVSDDGGHVPPGWDLSADDLQAIMGK